MTDLYLPDDGAKALPREIARFTNLKRLYLGSRRAQELPAELWPIVGLEELLEARAA